MEKREYREPWGESDLRKRTMEERITSRRKNTSLGDAERKKIWGRWGVGNDVRGQGGVRWIAISSNFKTSAKKELSNPSGGIKPEQKKNHIGNTGGGGRLKSISKGKDQRKKKKKKSWTSRMGG